MSELQRRDTLGIAEEAASWLMTLREDAVSDRADFIRWLRSSPRHVEEFLLITASDQALTNLDRDHRLDVEQMIAQLDGNVVTLKGVPRPDTATAPTKHAPRPRAGRITAYAAMLASIVVAAGWLLGHFRGADTYVTTVGEQRTVQLTDGSLIHLNALSKLTVRFFDDRRDVHLFEGEALFEVARDASRPFSVQTDRAIVRALGTEFNVDRRAHDTRVAVLEGSVQVVPIRTHRALSPSVISAPGTLTTASAEKLSAGELVRIASNGELTRSQGDTDDAVAWRKRLLVFSDSSLEEIATEFNRYNRKQQLVIDDELLRDERFGGTFEADEPLALIEFLRRTPGMAVVDEGDRLVIRRR